MKIKTKFFLVTVLIAVIPIIGGLVILNNTIQIVEESTEDTIAQVSLLKERALEAYIEETESIGNFFQQSAVVQEYLISLEKESDPKLESAVMDLLYSVQETNWGKYHHVFLLDETEKIILSPAHGKVVRGSPSSHVGEDTANNKWAREALTTGVTTISDYSNWTESDHSHQMLFFPLKNLDNITKAVLGFEMQIPYELAILAKDIELGESARAFIVSETGVNITYELSENQVMIDSVGIQKALSEGYYSGAATNENGVKVIGTYRKHDTYPWILAVEIDEKEALKNVHDIRNFFILSILLSTLLVAVIAYSLINNLINPINRLTAVAKSIADGNLQIRSDITSNDEIGAMSQAYNKMADTILESQSDLEAKVKERTKELTRKKEDLETINKHMVGRELKMIELKKEIAKLKK